ncbi:hypothetical protein BJV77DRAFT_1070036 [Russula vinacea]|nr:hypothetical protein BJV77DRAFT_1070036 [Russula vinacea]
MSFDHVFAPDAHAHFFAHNAHTHAVGLFIDTLALAHDAHALDALDHTLIHDALALAHAIPMPSPPTPLPSPQQRLL